MRHLTSYYEPTLIVRILLTVIFTFTSEKSSLLNNNFFITLTVILAIIGSRVYRNKYNAVIETFSYINLFILASVATPLSINDIDGKSVSMASMISVTLEIFSFLIIIVMRKVFLRREEEGGTTEIMGHS